MDQMEVTIYANAHTWTAGAPSGSSGARDTPSRWSM